MADMPTLLSICSRASWRSPTEAMDEPFLVAAYQGLSGTRLLWN